MILYTDRCLSCSDRKRLRALREFARVNGFDFKEVRVDRDKDMHAMATEIGSIVGVIIPFIEHEWKFINLSDDLEKLL